MQEGQIKRVRVRTRIVSLGFGDGALNCRLTGLLPHTTLAAWHGWPEWWLAGVLIYLAGVAGFALMDRAGLYSCALFFPDTPAGQSRHGTRRQIMAACRICGRSRSFLSALFRLIKIPVCFTSLESVLELASHARLSAAASGAGHASY